MSSVGCIDFPPAVFFSSVAVFISNLAWTQLTQPNVSIGQSQSAVSTKQLKHRFTQLSGLERCAARENPPAWRDKNRTRLFCRARYRHSRQSQRALPL